MIGTTAALVLGGLGGLQLFGAHKQAKAAEKASMQQQQSAQQALDLQRQMYQQTRQDLAPYMQQGGQGLTALSSLLGVGSPTGRGPASPPGMPNAMHPSMPQAVPRAPGAGGAPGAMVMLRAPTGQQQAVPADQVPFFLARGAQRV